MLLNGCWIQYFFSLLREWNKGRINQDEMSVICYFFTFHTSWRNAFTRRPIIWRTEREREREREEEEEREIKWRGYIWQALNMTRITEWSSHWGSVAVQPGVEQVAMKQIRRHRAQEIKLRNKRRDNWTTHNTWRVSLVMRNQTKKKKTLAKKLLLCPQIQSVLVSTGDPEKMYLLTEIM